MRHVVACLAMCLSVVYAAPAVAQASQPSLMEPLGRGVVALRSTMMDVVIGWRVLGTDPPDVSFNLLKRANAANQPIAGATGMVVIRRVKADPSYRVAVPY